jgi:hypothetical protein
MRSASFRFLLLFLAGCVLSLFLPAGLRAADPAAPKTDDAGWVLPGANAGTGWHIRLKDARAEAAKDGKPILILFTGPDWSSASKKFESSVLRSKEYAAVRPAAVGLYVQHFVKTDAPEEQVSANQSLRKALGVPAVYPCTVVLASDGKRILGMIPGAPDKKEYLRQISKLTGIALPE